MLSAVAGLRIQTCGRHARCSEQACSRRLVSLASGWHACCFEQACSGRFVSLALLVLGILTLPGCEARHVTIADTFPKAAGASPWVLQGDVWDGTFDQAAGALGEEAEAWRAFEPARVWLAVYNHDTSARHKLTARVFGFSSAQQARRAFEQFRPTDAEALEAGDEGCWTHDGVLVLWGRLVLDIFGNGAAAVASPEQAVYLLAFIEKQMPAGLPDAPQ